MNLDTTSLGNAVRRLREGLARYERDEADEQLRDGLIQRFEFNCELSHKMLRRYLRETAALPDDMDRMAFADFGADRKYSGFAAGRLAGLAPISRNPGPLEPHLRCKGGFTGRLGHSEVSGRSRAFLAELQRQLT